MNDEAIDKAAQFLATMRDGRPEANIEQCRIDVRTYLEVANAIKLAGLTPADPAGVLLQCIECSWAGPADQLEAGHRCPNCDHDQFKRIP